MKLVLVLAGLVALAGCNSTSRRPPVEIFPDMKRQAKYKPQAESAFFEDGRTSRPPVPGTVARGFLKEDSAFYTGTAGGVPVARNPVAIDRALLVHGQDRYNVYCAPCHDRAGAGQGIVALRGNWIATSLHDDRVRLLPDGEIFDVITHGRRTMPGYRFQIGARDRWAIVAYVRALQRAASGTLEDVPPELRSELR